MCQLTWQARIRIPWEC